MADAAESTGWDFAPAGSPALRAALRRVTRRERLRALALIAPLGVFLLAGFVLPVGLMLTGSFVDPSLASVLPRTAALMRRWTDGNLPTAATVEQFTKELAEARGVGRLGVVANRLNYDVDGFRGLIFKTARHLPGSGIRLPKLAAIDQRWTEPRTWAAIRRASHTVTGFYLLGALDRHTDAHGRIVPVPPDQRIFIDVFLRTFEIALVVTVAALLLGYPLAYLLATVPARVGNLLLIVVLLPFWTSVLVRTTAWVVLLQRGGVVNTTLHWLGLISQPMQLIYNRAGVYIAMIYVLLPFMVLPIYGVMRTLSPVSMRAARSLGAGPLVAFRRIYLPQTLPGISAGCLLVFILAIGFYTTPALVGGARDQMIAYFILFYTNQTLNWGLAAALSLILLVATLVLSLLYGILARGRASGLGQE